MITFAMPWVMLLLPLPWIFRKFMPPANLKYQAGLKVPFYNQLTKLANKGQKSGAINSTILLAYVVWTLLLLAASGPQWLGLPVELPRSGRDILLAIDISGSMEIPDMEMNHHVTNRISVVKQVGQDFIENRKGDRLGLILFGTRAYLETPLTFDLKTVKHMLQDATVGLAGTQTAIGDAIGMAIKHFKDFPKEEKVLILLTDGVNNEGNVAPLEAAKMAARYGIRIYTIGLGANKIFMPSFMGQQLTTGADDLDEETLKEISKVTNGIYFRARSPEDLADVYKQLNKIEPRLGDKDIFRPKSEMYYWPLGLALLITLFMMARIIFEKLSFPWFTGMMMMFVRFFGGI